MKSLALTLSATTALGLASAASASPYNDLVLAGNPISYYTFDGNADDAGSGDNDGTVVGATSAFPTTGGFQTQPPAGTGIDLGPYYSDNSGQGDYISLGSSTAGSLVDDLLGASAITVEFWIDFASLDGTTSNIVFLPNGNNSAAIGIQAQGGNTDRIRITGRSGDSGSFLSSSFATSPTAGDTYFVGIYDYANDQFRIFLDGEEVDLNGAAAGNAQTAGFAQNTFTPSLNGDEIFIGRSAAGDFVGDIDELAFYDRALTAAEISARYTAVPEPGAMALLGLGGLCMLARRGK